MRQTISDIAATMVWADYRSELQVRKIMYTKAPQRVAVPNFSGYNVQLPRLLEMEPDFTTPLYCWYYTLYTAHREGKTIQEVLEMEPALQAYAEADTGYKQFCSQYQYVSADPETRKRYVNWYKGLMRDAGIRDTAFEQGLEEGREEGNLKRLVQQIQRKKLKSKTRVQIIEELEMGDEDITILNNFDAYVHFIEAD